MSIRRGPASRAVVPGCVAAALLSLSLPALAGEVYGRITDGASSVGDAATVSVACGGKSYPARSTDKSGSYHIVVGVTGKCTLTVAYKGQSADLPIVSYETESQVDLVLETKDGKLTARRK